MAVETCDRPDRRQGLPVGPEGGHRPGPRPAGRHPAEPASSPRTRSSSPSEEQKAEISRRNDDPMTIARREVVEGRLRRRPPAGPRSTEYETIARDHPRRTWSTSTTPTSIPDRMYLVVVGDFDSQRHGREDREGVRRLGQGRPAAAGRSRDPRFPAHGQYRRQGRPHADDDLHGRTGIRADDPQLRRRRRSPTRSSAAASPRGCSTRCAAAQGLAYSVGSMAGTGWRYPGMFARLHDDQDRVQRSRRPRPSWPRSSAW